MRKKFYKILVIAAVIVGMVTTVIPTTSFAASTEIPVSYIYYTTTCHIKNGQTKELAIKVNPSNTTYKIKVDWEVITNNVFTVKKKSYGTYYGTPASITITGKHAGYGRIYATVKYYNSKNEYLKTHHLTTYVEGSELIIITQNGNASTSTSKKTTATKNTASTNGYLNVTGAYTELNKFRLSKSVWQWNPNNKTKQYFNTNAKNKLNKLKRDVKLEQTAKVRAKEIAKKFSHTRPNGKSCFTAFPAATYKGENIAYGYSSAKSVTSAWKETNEKYGGQGHRRNMLNKNFNAVGIACYKKGGTKYWVQCFAKR